MNGEQLKNSILQFAIQGKLVPQDPNDEPASFLVQRIRAENNHPKNDSFIYRGDDGCWYEDIGLSNPVCIDNQIPFEIPTNWCWSRMGQIIEFVNGRAYKKEELLSKGKYRVLRVGNFYTNQSWYYSDLELPDEKYCYRGDLLYAWSASFGPKIWNQDKTIFHYHIWNLNYNKKCLFREYLYYYLLYDKTQVKSSTTGSTMIHVSMEHMMPRLIPIPPLAEQKRIVAKLEEILPLVESYDKAQQKLDELNKALPDRLRKSILQEAIQGKLVEQDPSDEPASILLERIREEKQKLVKAKVIKADKNESTIYRGEDGSWYEKVGKSEPKCIDEQLPFNVPKHWYWVRVGQIFNVRSAMRIHQTDWQKHGIPFFRGRELVQLAKTGHVDFEIYLSRELYEKNKEKGGVPQKDDILISAVGTIGKTYIVKGDKEFYYKDAYILCLENIGKMYPNYMELALNAPYLQKQIHEDAQATTVAQLTIERCKELLIPFPPLAEQKRIVAKLDELLKHIK